MSASFAVTQQILSLLEPGREYRASEIGALLVGRMVTPVQRRNALCGLCANGRLLARGKHSKYLYRLNPNPPLLRADAARATRAALGDTHGAGYRTPEPTPAIAPNWAVIDAALLRRNLAWRITA